MGVAISSMLKPQCGDHVALHAACAPGVALCTIVGIDGAFSRRVGSQLAILADATVVGSLSDTCLEQQLASDAQGLAAPATKRYGRGSEMIDFRLPCGGGLDILIDPSPDRAVCRAVAGALSRRQPASLPLPENGSLQSRAYIPALAIAAFGEGPELTALARIGKAAGIAVEMIGKDALALGREPDRLPPDRWTATVILFHDHEWEAAILRHALTGEAFYIGAQGGEEARLARVAHLLSDGIDEGQVARVRGPIGAIVSCRDPETLALSVLAEITGEYDKLRACNR